MLAISFVLAAGCRWEDVPVEMGCPGLGDPAGLGPAARRPAEAGRPARGRPGRRRWRDRPVPSPVDRSRKGTKHTLVVDRRGVPLAIRTAGANASDHRQIIPVVLDYPEVGGVLGRTEELPDGLFAGRGCDLGATRGLLRWPATEPHIARRRTPHGSGLGKVRWVVERTIRWLKGLRRMRVRYDRLLVVREAWATLAACVICYRLLHDELPAAG